MVIRLALGVSSSIKNTTIDFIDSGLGDIGPALVTVESIHFTNIGGASGTNWPGLAIVGDIGQVNPTVPNNLIAIVGAPNANSTTDNMKTSFKIRNASDIFKKQLNLKFMYMSAYASQTWTDTSEIETYECIIVLRIEPEK